MLFWSNVNLKVVHWVLYFYLSHTFLVDFDVNKSQQTTTLFCYAVCQSRHAIGGWGVKQRIWRIVILLSMINQLRFDLTCFVCGKWQITDSSISQLTGVNRLAVNHSRKCRRFAVATLAHDVLFGVCEHKPLSLLPVYECWPKRNGLNTKF